MLPNEAAKPSQEAFTPVIPSTFRRKLTNTRAVSEQALQAGARKMKQFSGWLFSMFSLRWKFLHWNSSNDSPSVWYSCPLSLAEKSLAQPRALAGWVSASWSCGQQQPGRSLAQVSALWDTCGAPADWVWATEMSCVCVQLTSSGSSFIRFLSFLCLFRMRICCMRPWSKGGGERMSILKCRKRFFTVSKAFTQGSCYGKENSLEW